MEGVSRHSWLRSARSPSIPLLALIVLLGVGGYLLTSTTIRHDRDEAAARRARVVTVQAQEVLGRARAYVDGLAQVLAREPEPEQARFAHWARATSASVGLNDVLWVERVPSSQRRRYERLRGVPITRLTATGRLAAAPAARSYLPATFTSQTRPELRPGVDVTGFPALADAIRDRARIFAVGASRPGALGGESGVFLLEAAAFAGGRDRRGYLVVFVPRGWFTTSLGGDPRRVAISEDGKPIERRLDAVHASAGFEMLGRRWRIDVAREPPSDLQSMLPWLALAWPFAVAAVALPIGRATTLRRRAQRETERIFTLSTDVIAVANFHGYFTRVNPAGERVLGYSEDELLARPYLDFVHPDDRERTAAEAAAIASGKTTLSFENRYVHKDGSYRVLEWTSTAVVEDGLIYAMARDVTERRQAEAEVERLAHEQAALRRVATLVAQGVPSAELFNAVSSEVGRLFGSDMAAVARFDPDGPANVVVGMAKTLEGITVGSRWELVDGMAAAEVYRTGRSARTDVDWSSVDAPIAAPARRLGVASSVSSPIVVEGELWGNVSVAATEPLPAHTEERLEKFTELVATAISNAESREALSRLAEEQAALRRVATLIAREAPQAEVFMAVAAEIGRLLGTEESRMLRYEDEHNAVVAASWGESEDVFPTGSRVRLEGDSAASRVFRTGQPARIDDYRTVTSPMAERVLAMGIRSVVAAPILVEGRLWGAMTTGTGHEQPLPPDTESRLLQFTELMATAIANTESRAEAERLAEEQAALRRVATLVAEGAPPAAVFDAVAAEMEGLLGADGVTVSRYEPGDEVTVVAHRGSDSRGVPPGTRVSHRGENVTSSVRRSERSARMEHHEVTHGAIAQLARDPGVRASVGAPVVVDGRLWGVAVATWRGDESPPADTEERMAKFAELLDTAIANADSRDQLTASRARLLTEGDEARRRVVRDLHDGAQQRLVHTIVTLKFARQALRERDGDAESLVGQALELAEQGNEELRELAHGILPAVLTRGGLRAAVRSLVSRLDVPVQVDVPADRFPAEIEASAYFIVAEALTNVVKHAHAGRAEVRASVEDGMLRLEVCDDGIGGADPDGHGLVGMGDRATALGGRLQIESPAGGGTLVAATLPLSERSSPRPATAP
jgi:PAS domain S-box-containing protein